MRIAYLGKDKPSVIAGLRFLVERGADVATVVGPSAPGDGTTLTGVATELGLPVDTPESLVAGIQSGTMADLDIVVSFLFWQRIREPLLSAGRVACLNFHPAPLPDFRGVGGYNLAVYEQLPSWGVSAHHVADSFDTGDLIEVRRFDIDARTETAWTLERRTQPVLLELFQDVMRRLLDGETLPRIRQGEGRYVDRREFEELRRIAPTDTPDEIDRKIRAFWFPPYDGATVEMQGETFTLVNRFVLERIAADLPP